MSPPSVRSQRCRDSRKVKNPRRAGSPERGQPHRSIRKTSRRRRVGTSSRPTRGGGAGANKAPDRTIGASALEGGNARRHRRSAPARARRTERARRRDRGPEAGRVRTHLKERGESTRRTAGGQGPPRGGPTGARRTPRSEKPVDARGPARVPAGTGVDAAKEVPKPRTRHAAGPGGLAGTGPPFWYVSWGRKAQGRKHRRTRGPLGVPATVRGCCDGPLKRTKAQGGPASGAIRLPSRLVEARRA
jgi:hypothetical protein